MPRYSTLEKETWLRLYEQSGEIMWVVRRVAASRNTVTKALYDQGVPKTGTGGRRRPYGRAPRWSRYLTPQGYAIWKSHVDGQVIRIAESRLVMERYLGRPLEAWEHVHHRNAIRDDNALTNLEVVTSHTHRPGPTHCRHCGGEL